MRDLALAFDLSVRRLRRSTDVDSLIASAARSPTSPFHDADFCVLGSGGLRRRSFALGLGLRDVRARDYDPVECLHWGSAETEGSQNGSPDWAGRRSDRVRAITGLSGRTPSTPESRHFAPPNTEIFSRSNPRANSAQEIRSLSRGTYSPDDNPSAAISFLAGSVIRGEQTATSDLDIVVVFDELPNVYRESLGWDEWAVEVFVRDVYQVTGPGIQSATNPPA